MTHQLRKFAITHLVLELESEFMLLPSKMNCIISNDPYKFDKFKEFQYLTLEYSKLEKL